MSTNPKNLLQEFCQKNGKSLPVYSTMATNSPGKTTGKASGKSGSLLFASSVKLWDNTVFTGDVFPNKKKSESDAAFKAYQALKSSTKKLIVTSECSALILINFEGVNCVDLVKNYDFSPLVTPLFYITKNHPYSSQKDGKFIVIDSRLKESIDVGILVTVTDLLLRNCTIYNRIIVLSGGNIIKAFSDLYIQKFITNGNSTELTLANSMENLFELKGISVEEK